MLRCCSDLRVCVMMEEPKLCCGYLYCGEVFCVAVFTLQETVLHVVWLDVRGERIALCCAVMGRFWCLGESRVALCFIKGDLAVRLSLYNDERERMGVWPEYK